MKGTKSQLMEVDLCGEQALGEPVDPQELAPRSCGSQQKAPTPGDLLGGIVPCGGLVLSTSPRTSSQLFRGS